MNTNCKLFIFLPVLLTSFLFFGCMKEQGSYQHKSVNEVVIDTADLVKQKTVQLGAKLIITPTIDQTLEATEDNLEYVWYWYKFGFIHGDTISRSRNLEFTVPMRTDLGVYTTVFKAYDKKTGIYSKRTFNVNVTASASEGVLVLSNLDGNAELGILNIANNYIGSLYYDANGANPGKNPVSIGFIKTNAVPYLNGMVILCDDSEGGKVAHHLDFMKLYDYRKFFFVPPSIIKPQRYYNGITGLDARYDFIINNNQLHVREYRNAQRVEEKTFFKPPLQPLDIEVSPSAIVNATTLLFYDNTNYKFMMVGITSLQYLSKHFIPVYLGTQDESAMVFNPNDVRLRLIDMAPGWQNHGYGIFKDPETEKLYLLSFSISSLGFNTPFSAYTKTEITNAPGIGSATDYAYSIRDPYIFYSKENILYKYDTKFDLSQPIYNLDTVISNSQIDKLYMRYYAGQTNNSGKLYVASSEKNKNGKNGSLHVLQINRSGDVNRVDSVYKNVSGRVVSMDYKF